MYQESATHRCSEWYLVSGPSPVVKFKASTA